MNKRAVLLAAMCGTLRVTATPAHDDAVLEWNAIMVETTATQNPIAQGRLAAITQLAVFEAVNAIDHGYDAYVGIVQAPPGASPDAAAIAAAHAALTHYFPASAAALDAARSASLARITDGPAKQQGIAVGEAAAASVIALRENDGAAPPRFHLPDSSRPGEWQPTPSCPAAGGVLLQWSQLRPFVIRTPDQFRAPPPPPVTSWRYARDYREVKLLGAADSTLRSQERADVARFYAATAPVPVWNSTTRQVAEERGDSLAQNARALALVNAAIADAQIAVFETKYHYDFWRPETAIRAGDRDGNPWTRGDAAFAPLVTTPCFPSYASAHGSSSAAAREILERLYGRRHHFIELDNAALPGIELQYESFRDITNDIDDARIYGGIHFRFDQEAGALIGRQVGAYALRNALRAAQELHEDGP